MYVRDGAKCVDSAFGNACQDFLIKPFQELIHIENYQEQIIAHDVTFMQQSAEWGMHAFKLLMPHVKERTKFEVGDPWKNVIFSNSLWTNSGYPNSLKYMSSQYDSCKV